MARPAGVQIRRWFVLLVGLLIAVDLAALAGSLIVSRAVRGIVDQAAPLAAGTAAIRQEILFVQRDLFRYLSEFTGDTSGALEHLEALVERVAEAKTLNTSSEVASELETIKTNALRYRKVLELMPSTVGGSRDWSRLQEYSSTAVELGDTIEQRASRLAEAAQTEIHKRSNESAKVASLAIWACAGVLTASVVTILALRHWWKRFQDLILGF